MNIFEDIIDDSIIKGISRLTTDYKEKDNTIQYSFRVFCTRYEVFFPSDIYHAGDDKKQEREAWLSRYAQVKEEIARQLKSTTESTAHKYAVEETYAAIGDNLNKVFKALLPGGPTLNSPVNSYVAGVYNQLSILKDLALK